MADRAGDRDVDVVAWFASGRQAGTNGSKPDRILASSSGDPQIQASGRVYTKTTGRLQNPDRVYFDLLGAKLVGHGNDVESISVGDELLRRVRIARRQGGITRVVLDLRKPAQVPLGGFRAQNPVRRLRLHS